MTAHRTLSDLRLLRLAVHFEETFERYEEHLRGLIPEPLVRAKLAVLFEEGPHHRQLKRAHDELLVRNEHLETDGLTTDDILQTLLDCETAAREFYLYNLDRLFDPHLIQLFAKLAEEEELHVRAVQEAMLLNSEAPMRTSPPP